MNLRKELKIFGGTILIASYIILFYLIIMAHNSGTWTLTLDFNHYGEGIFELILYIIGIPSVYLYLCDKK